LQARAEPTQALLEREFDRQLAGLERLGYPARVGMSPDAFADLLLPLRARVGDLPADPAGAELPFVVVPDRTVIPAEESMLLVEQGVVDMNPTGPEAFRPTPELELPAGPAYLAVDLDTGAETMGVTPNDALPLIADAGRSPLTIEEGIALLTHHPGVLRSHNAYSLLGSRAGDKRVPALWISKGRPRLGWCWAGNPHSWLGSASCAFRLGAP
jgi:hypothetical protein